MKDFSSMSLFWLYKKTMTVGRPLIGAVLSRRVAQGKEDPARLDERCGIPSLPRPAGALMWVHVASVGEAQSMLPMVSLFLDQNPSAHVLITSVTRTAAELLAKRLPPRSFHQYLPVDRTKWVRRFLDHWKPDVVLWAESELWPVMVVELNKRHLPVALLNARMSPKSFRNWSRAKGMAEQILSSFTVILTQTEQDKNYYTALGGRSVVVTDNIKYCAEPLPCDAAELETLRQAIGGRPVWVYASTHAGEEELALDVHRQLEKSFPDLLSVIVPRHPERAAQLDSFFQENGASVDFRNQKPIPDSSTKLYVVDRLGELGLFYRLAQIACIGRSFSDDGGGGHNPLEAALLGCAVLHGPDIQNLQDIYDQMDRNGAAIPLAHKSDLPPALASLFSDLGRLATQRQKGYDFAQSKTHILKTIIEELEPVFLMAHLPVLKAEQK